MSSYFTPKTRKSNLDDGDPGVASRSDSLRQAKAATCGADLVLAEDSKRGDNKFGTTATTDPTTVLELSQEAFVPLTRHLCHRRIVGAVRYAVVLTLMSLLLATTLAGPASSANSRSTLRRPSASSIRYLKRHLVGWARQRDGFWQAYLAGGPFHFADCTYNSSGALVTYGCTLEDIGGAQLAIFVLGRISSTCSYGFTFGAPSARRQFTKTFRYCG